MLDRGLTIFRVRGIPVKLHLSLLIFLPLVALMATRQLGYVASTLGIARSAFTLPPIVWGAILAVGLFVAVLAHELCHCLVAIRYGARVRAILLMMLGGISFIEDDLPPRREAWMAFAGPLASFGIAVVSYVVFLFLPLPAELAAAVLAFAMTNAVIGAFNLLPAFPLDGGRVLRGLLAGPLGIERATSIAARVGKILAVALAIYAALTLNLILLLIAWFVYAGAGAEQDRRSIHREA